MNIVCKGYTLHAEKVSGQLSKSEIKGLTLWLSYDEPIAICYPTKVIITDADFSSTTSRHINHVKSLYDDILIMPYEEFQNRVIDLLSGNWLKV
jgi:hypothetical protein